MKAVRYQQVAAVVIWLALLAGLIAPLALIPASPQQRTYDQFQREW
jgi:hypothetical protein